MDNNNLSHNFQYDEVENELQALIKVVIQDYIKKQKQRKPLFRIKIYNSPDFKICNIFWKDLLSYKTYIRLIKIKINNRPYKQEIKNRNKKILNRKKMIKKLLKETEKSMGIEAAMVAIKSKNPISIEQVDKILHNKK